MAGNVADDVCCAEGRSTGRLLVEKRNNYHPFLRKDDAMPAISPDTLLSTLCRQWARGHEQDAEDVEVQKLLDYLVKRYRDVYTPRRELSVDETMLKFKGRLSIEKYQNQAGQMGHQVVYSGRVDNWLRLGLTTIHR